MEGMEDDLQLSIPMPEDGWFYEKMLSDPATMAYNAPWFPPDGCIPHPEAEWNALQADWIGQEPKRFYAYLQRKSDGAFVGDVNYHYNPAQDWWDMGIVIYAPERGRGYGKQGLRLLADKAFSDGVKRLHNEFETDRGAAYQIHKSVGFRVVGRENGLVQLELTREDNQNCVCHPQEKSTRRIETQEVEQMLRRTEIAGEKDYQTEKLLLHFVTEDDLAEVARTWPSDHHPLSGSEAREAIAYMRGNYERNTKGCIYHLCLAVCGEEHPGTILGWCGLDGTRNHSEPEIFILLEEAYRNRGYGTQCVSKLLRIAVEDYALSGVHGGCAKENIASARAMEKGGMVRYGTEENGDPLYRFPAKEKVER